VAEPDDEDSSWLDLPPAKGAYKYRLAAWSQFGRSTYAGSIGSACAIRYVQQDPQQPLTATDMQTLLAAVAAAGGNLSGGQAVGGGLNGTAASGGVWSWSAASSAAIVSLTILLKASQLRVGGVVLAVWRRCAARTWWLAGQRGDAGTGSTEEVGETEQEAQQAGSGAVLSGGMRRAGSSRVSLAGLSSEQGMCEASAEQQLAAGGSWAHRSGSRQQLGGSEQAGAVGGMQAEVPGAVGTAAAAAEADSAAEQLQQAILRGAHCAHPGCHRRFDRLRDLRRKLEVRWCWKGWEGESDVGVQLRGLSLSFMQTTAASASDADGAEPSCDCQNKLWPRTKSGPGVGWFTEACITLDRNDWWSLYMFDGAPLCCSHRAESLLRLVPKSVLPTAHVSGCAAPVLLMQRLKALSVLIALLAVFICVAATYAW
jgi:hypothetical protein